MTGKGRGRGRVRAQGSGRDGLASSRCVESAERLGKPSVTPRGVAKKGARDRGAKGTLHGFALVDALTRLAREQENAGDRTDADEKASALLTLAV